MTMMIHFQTLSTRKVVFNPLNFQLKGDFSCFQSPVFAVFTQLNVASREIEIAGWDTSRWKAAGPLFILLLGCLGRPGLNF